MLMGVFALTSRILSFALVLDLISLWPGAIPGLLAIPILFNRKLGNRGKALPPLFWLSWLVLGVTLHLSAWGPLPTTAAELKGPPWGAGEEIYLSATLDGDIEVSQGTATNLYRVAFIRRGGSIGVPEAIERVLATARGDDIINPGQIRLKEQATHNSLLRFAGWDLALHPEARWDLQLDPGSGDAALDFTGLRISNAELFGKGELRLSEPLLLDPVISLHGEYRVEIPDRVPATVTGLAVLPDNWARSFGGGSSPATGSGWNLVVEPGAIVTIVSVG